MLQCEYVLEQPVSSIHHRAPHIEATYEHTMAERDITWLGSYGASSPKPLAFWGTPEWLSDLYRQRPKKGQCQELLAVRKGGKVSGRRKSLAASQCYPQAFGRAVAQAIAGSDSSL